MEQKWKFRTLTADEVECRVGSIDKDGKWLSLLLYKDARVDQKLLDEVVGQTNWQNYYEEVKGVLHCIIEIWDEDKKVWIKKMNCGVESNTEAQKGEASDAFKRACFNVGIGRELYDAPRIIVNIDSNNTKWSRYKVTKLEYDSNRKPTLVEIINEKTKQVVFTYPKKTATQTTMQTTTQTATKPAVAQTSQRVDMPISAEVADEIRRTTSTNAINAVWKAHPELQNSQQFYDACVAQQKRLSIPAPQN